MVDSFGSIMPGSVGRLRREGGSSALVRDVDEEEIPLHDVRELRSSRSHANLEEGSPSKSMKSSFQNLTLRVPGVLEAQASLIPLKQAHTYGNYFLLIFLCNLIFFISELILSIFFIDVLQGIPLGLVHGTIPYLLKSQRDNDLSFTDLGLFSLASYPYTLKLLWSPLVDSYYFRSIGRRKSWIIPSQFLTGILFLIIGFNVNEWISNADADITAITFAFTLLICGCATQDIAVDGWALTILGPNNTSFSSSCQTIGLTIGYFMAFTIFLALNSAEFCNTYLRYSGVTYSYGLLDISSFLKFWGFVSIFATVIVVLVRREAEALSETAPRTLRSAYQLLLRIFRLPNIKRLAMLLLICRIGFTALDVILPLKLIEKGFPRDKIALLILIDFPCQLVAGFCNFTKPGRPLWAWRWALFLKQAMAALGMIVLYAFPEEGEILTTYFLLVLAVTILSSLASTWMYASLNSFFSLVSDPSIGGTYLSFLNTLSNMGVLVPKFLILTAIDWFSIGIDGFYIVNTLCLIIGISSAIYILLPTVNFLEASDPLSWKINQVPVNFSSLV